MEEKNNSFIHDTINLEEIRGLLGEEPQPDILTEPLRARQPEESTQKSEANKLKNDQEEQKKSKETQSKGFAKEFYDMLHDLIYILAAVTLLFVFVVRLVGVDGTSMLPTLHNGDFLLLESNFLYSTDEIQNGDIVVINEPYHWQRDKSLIVKRVIATEGQTVEIDFDTGTVTVDGAVLQEDYINAPTYFYWEGEYGLEFPATVPQGHIFVLGDNRNNSSDSRFAPVGMIDERCVLGKALAVVLPGETKDLMGETTDPRDWGRIGLVK